MDLATSSARMSINVFHRRENVILSVTVLTVLMNKIAYAEIILRLINPDVYVMVILTVMT